MNERKMKYMKYFNENYNSKKHTEQSLKSNVMSILKSIICKPCTDDFNSYIFDISIASFGFCAVLTIFTDKPTDRPYEETF